MNAEDLTKDIKDILMMSKEILMIKKTSGVNPNITLKRVF